MSRKGSKRNQKREATRKEVKEDKKDLKSILEVLKERYGTDSAALREAVEILLSTAAYLAKFSHPMLEPPYREILGFLTITNNEEDEDDKEEGRPSSDTIIIP